MNSIYMIFTIVSCNPFEGLSDVAGSRMDLR